jgi:hypothetical protein
MMIRATGLLGSALILAATPSFSAEPTRTTAQPPANAVGNPQSGSAPAKPVSASARNAPDRLDLDVSVVTGNRELPKVLYIVPWKKAELGDLPDQPFNSLLDEALKPVDRDEFRREVAYFARRRQRWPTMENLRLRQLCPDR